MKNKMIKRMKPILLSCCLALFLTGFVKYQLLAQNIPGETPVALINEIYKAVSVRKGESADWERVRSMFTDDAIVILRTGPRITKQFTADGYIQDFKDFCQYESSL